MIEAHPITLTIDRGDWGGTAACNHYGGTVAVDGNQLTIHDVVVTEMACPDPGVMESERAPPVEDAEHVLDVLSGRVGYELVARRLVLVAPDGGGLDYRAP